jgi:hypothetical protein
VGTCIDTGTLSRPLWDERVTESLHFHIGLRINSKGAVGGILGSVIAPLLTFLVLLACFTTSLLLLRDVLQSMWGISVNLLHLITKRSKWRNAVANGWVVGLWAVGWTQLEDLGAARVHLPACILQCG